MNDEIKEVPEAEEVAKAKVKPKKREFKATYIGEGAHLIGVPARDLSKAEWEALSDGIQDTLLKQGIMRVTK